MRSLILQTIARGILPVAALFALFLLLRGHDEPGGGFIAGLVAGAAIVLQGLAFGIAETRRVLAPLLRFFLPLGLAVAIGTGLVSLALGDGFLTHYHAKIGLAGRDGYLHLSTALLFDIGVFLVVVGVSSSLLSEFAKEAP